MANGERIVRASSQVVFPGSMPHQQGNAHPPFSSNRWRISSSICCGVRVAVAAIVGVGRSAVGGGTVRVGLGEEMVAGVAVADDG